MPSQVSRRSTHTTMGLYIEEDADSILDACKEKARSGSVETIGSLRAHDSLKNGLSPEGDE